MGAPMQGTETQHQRDDMEYSPELCHLRHEHLEKEVGEMKSTVMALKKSIDGGNGSGIGLAAKVDKNTDFRVEMQGYLRKINAQFYVIVFMLVGIIVGLLNGMMK